MKIRNDKLADHAQKLQFRLATQNLTDAGYDKSIVYFARTNAAGRGRYDDPIGSTYCHDLFGKEWRPATYNELKAGMTDLMTSAVVKRLGSEWVWAPKSIQWLDSDSFSVYQQFEDKELAIQFKNNFPFAYANSYFPEYHALHRFCVAPL